MEKLIVVNLEDETFFSDYVGDDSIYNILKSVSGENEKMKFFSLDFATDNGTLKANFYCDAFINTIDTTGSPIELHDVNTFATLISGTRIRGNIVIVVDSGNGEERGFEFSDDFKCEANCVDLIIQNFCIRYENEFEDMHKDIEDNVVIDVDTIDYMPNCSLELDKQNEILKEEFNSEECIKGWKNTFCLVNAIK